MAARRYLSVGALQTRSGGFLPDVQVAYEAFGTLNSARDNACLICHAVSGDSHVIGWWKEIVGPGKAIDTDRLFVIGNNLLGGCQGTTGPSSKAEDGKPYGSRFPFITIEDMVDVQARLLDELGIEKVLCVAGGSTGGFLALDWGVRYPHRVAKVFATAACARATPLQVGFHEVERQAIIRDPCWKGGDYYETGAPEQGLAIARMLGHLTYLSPKSFERKFGRRLQGKAAPEYTWEPEFEVESYLRHQGEGFTKRFDPNTLLYFLRALDYFDLESLSGAEAEFLFCSFTSDWFYPPAQGRELHEMAIHAGCVSTFEEINLPYGHDCFLLDGGIQGGILRKFLMPG